MRLWTVIVLCAISGLVGCTSTVTVRVSPLQPEDLGPATICEWHERDPANCVVDLTRRTIDMDYLSNLLDQLQRCHNDEYDRRKL